jgi:hypothetical protein
MAHYNAFKSSERASLDADPPTRCKVGVWLGSSQSQCHPETFNLFVWYLHRQPAETHDVDDPGNLESTQALEDRDANEHIAGKERQIYVRPTLVPVAD